MASLTSLRPSLSQAVCKRQICAYLTQPTRLAHTVAAVPTAPSVPPSRRKRVVKAKAAVPSNVLPKSPYYGKLQPYDLSKRLRALTDKGELDAAVDMLKSMPLAAQNVSVWNAVIKAAFDAGKLKLAFSLYTDMKRRGFRPNVRTYTTMLSGYHRIPSWEGFANQLQNLHSVYRSFMDYIEAVPEALDEGNTPYAVRAAVSQYLDVCCNAHESAELQEAFERLPLHGPLARDARMYVPYLRDLLRQELPPAELVVRVRERWTEVQGMWAKDPASDARTYGFLTDLVFQGLTQSPSIADHSYAFEIVRDTFALHPQGKASPSSTKGIAMPHSIIANVLSTAGLLGRSDFVLDFAKLVPRRNDLQETLSMSLVHRILSAAREAGRRDNAKMLVDLVHIIATRSPHQLDKATFTVQGILKHCLECEDFSAAKSALSAILRVRPSELATVRQVHHAKTVTTTSWSYFAHCALYGNASDARLAIAILEKQAGHLIQDVVSGQPLKGEFKAAFAQTLVQLAERCDNSSTPSWYMRLRTRVDAYASGQQSLKGLTTPVSDDPFAPGAATDTSLEVDALELTEDMAKLDISETDMFAQAAGSSIR
ncbi:hypothetical protein PENSPDRAFT_759695 [Peniophora sp. CONT]|nr:hypothetical protein PENSPDRAFT_759695 [Peniophora sp. CONT]